MKIVNGFLGIKSHTRSISAQMCSYEFFLKHALMNIIIIVVVVVVINLSLINLNKINKSPFEVPLQQCGPYF